MYWGADSYTNHDIGRGFSGPRTEQNTGIYQSASLQKKQEH